MKDRSLCIGIFFEKYDVGDVFKFIQNIRPVKRYIRDFQYAIHDPAICKSGRVPKPIPKDFLLLFTRLMKSNGYNTTLLLNQAQDENIDRIIAELKDYVDNGLTGICTQSIPLAKRVKVEYPMLEIQSSCLTYHLKYEDFADEIDAGFTVFNPINDIIRDVDNLKRNHEKGLVQKILVAEGCLNKCPYELKHRKAISTGEYIDSNNLCLGILKKPENFHLFLKANWITIKRMIELEEYIDVIKLQRGSLNLPKTENSLDLLSRRLVTFVDRYLKTQNGEYVNYNILEYTSTCIGDYFYDIFKKGIPSKIIDDHELFNNLDNSNRLNDIIKDIFYINNV